jgi:hypothetical protein
VRYLNPGLQLRVLLFPHAADLNYALELVRSGVARVRGVPWHAKGSGPTF